MIGVHLVDLFENSRYIFNLKLLNGVDVGKIIGTHTELPFPPFSGIRIVQYVATMKLRILWQINCETMNWCEGAQKIKIIHTQYRNIIIFYHNNMLYLYTHTLGLKDKQTKYSSPLLKNSWNENPRSLVNSRLSTINQLYGLIGKRLSVRLCARMWL